jgi:hypothetical protein
MSLDDVSFTRVGPLQPGGTYVLEADRDLSMAEIAEIQRGWTEAAPADVKVIVLAGGLRLRPREDDASTQHEPTEE